jgi:probable rRNA maturation factor
MRWTRVAKASRRARRRSPSLLHSGLDTVRGARADSRIAVDVACDGVRCPLSVGRVREVVRDTLSQSGVRQAMLSVTFVSRRAIARLNRKHLGHEGPTDVITFALGHSGPHGAVVGDIYISPDVARENARKFSASVREEVARLVVHGTLHVAGRTHPEGEGRTRSKMWREQESLVRNVG